MTEPLEDPIDCKHPIGCRFTTDYGELEAEVERLGKNPSELHEEIDELIDQRIELERVHGELWDKLKLADRMAKAIDLLEHVMWPASAVHRELLRDLFDARRTFGPERKYKHDENL